MGEPPQDERTADAADLLRGDKTFRSFDLDDYFERHRRTDHRSNAVLHAALSAFADADGSRIANVNLMASHAPPGPEREAKGEPTYDVVVDVENGGAGTASTGPTVIDRMLRRFDVVVTRAEALSIADPEGGDYPVDRLTVHLNPVETIVRPVEVPYSAIPDDAKGVVSTNADGKLVDTRAELRDTLGGVDE